MRAKNYFFLLFPVYLVVSCQTPGTDANRGDRATVPVTPAPTDVVAQGLSVALPLPLMGNPRAQDLYMRNSVLTQYAHYFLWQGFERRDGKIFSQGSESIRNVRISTTASPVPLENRTVEMYYLSFLAPRQIDPPHRLVEAVIGVQELGRMDPKDTLLPQDFIRQVLSSVRGNNFRARLVGVEYDPARGFLGRVLLAP